MSRCIAKIMYINLSKRSTFWNGGSTSYFEISIEPNFLFLQNSSIGVVSQRPARASINKPRSQDLMAVPSSNPECLHASSISKSWSLRGARRGLAGRQEVYWNTNELFIFSTNLSSQLNWLVHATQYGIKANDLEFEFWWAIKKIVAADF